MSFLGFMYLDTHVALPKKLAQAFFPDFDLLAQRW